MALDGCGLAAGEHDEVAFIMLVITDRTTTAASLLAAALNSNLE